MPAMHEKASSDIDVTFPVNISTLLKDCHLTAQKRKHHDTRFAGQSQGSTPQQMKTGGLVMHQGRAQDSHERPQRRDRSCGLCAHMPIRGPLIAEMLKMLDYCFNIAYLNDGLIHTRYMIDLA